MAAVAPATNPDHSPMPRTAWIKYLQDLRRCGLQFVGGATYNWVY